MKTALGPTIAEFAELKSGDGQFIEDQAENGWNSTRFTLKIF